jgi:hypothetical protein
MRAISVSVGPGASAGATSNMVRLDEWADSPLGVQVSLNGAANFTLQHSFDDPNDLISPVPLANMFWDTGLFPAAAIGGSAGITFGILTAPLWVRILLNSGAGTVKAVLTQYNVVEP